MLIRLSFNCLYLPMSLHWMGRFCLNFVIFLEKIFFSFFSQILIKFFSNFDFNFVFNFFHFFSNFFLNFSLHSLFFQLRSNDINISNRFLSSIHAKFDGNPFIIVVIIVVQYRGQYVRFGWGLWSSSTNPCQQRASVGFVRSGSFESEFHYNIIAYTWNIQPTIAE